MLSLFTHSHSAALGCNLPIVSSRWCCLLLCCIKCHHLRREPLPIFVAHDLVLALSDGCMYLLSPQGMCVHWKSPVIVPVTALLVLQSDPCWSVVWNVIYLWHAAPSAWNTSICLLTCPQFCITEQLVAERLLFPLPVVGTVVGASIRPSSESASTDNFWYCSVCCSFLSTLSPS